MDRQTRRMLQSFFNKDTKPYGESCWVPSVDIYRAGDAWLVKFDLAGVRGEDLKMDADARRLRISGIRRDLSMLKNQTAYSMEISYNRFERSVELPIDLTEAKIRSEYRDGMLMVLINPRGGSDD